MDSWPLTMTFPPPPPSPLSPWQRWLGQLAAALMFYTQLPVPYPGPLVFAGIARHAPGVGLFLGGLLALGDHLLALGGMPQGPRSALIVALWLWLTGGLHLDGAMDTADGLAVLDPERRLAVMADSRTGAFGAMAAVVILGLKGVALGALDHGRWFALMAAAGWGRWGQVVAIARYPYLKATGKGAFHKAHAQPRTDWLLGAIALLLLGAIAARGQTLPLSAIGGLTLGSAVLAGATAAWFHHRLGGHTGDTYGAVVEWTEALALVLATALWPFP